MSAHGTPDGGDRSRSGIPLGMLMLAELARAVRLALRRMRREPATQLGIVLSVAVGVATATATTSLLEAAVLTAPRGVDRAHELVAITRAGDGRGAVPWTAVPAGTAAMPIAAWDARRGWLDYGGQRVPLSIEVVTPNYFDVLGVRPLHGRWPSQRSDTADAALSHDVWQVRFDGNPRVVDRVLQLNGRPVRVSGIAPPGFTGLRRTGAAAAWVVAAQAAALLPGGLGAEATAFTVGRVHSPGAGAFAAPAGSRALPLADGIGGVDWRRWRGLMRLLAHLVLGLSIGCAAVLMVHDHARRAADRRTRSALGAAPAALRRTDAVEALTTAAVAGGLGWMGARVLVAFFGSLPTSAAMPLSPAVTLDGVAVAVAAGIAAAALLVVRLLAGAPSLERPDGRPGRWRGALPAVITALVVLLSGTAAALSPALAIREPGLGLPGAGPSGAGAFVILLPAAAWLTGVLGIAAALRYDVARRHQELGVRLALGATPGRIAARVVGRAVHGAAVGALIGWALTAALTPVLTRLPGVGSGLTAALTAVPGLLVLVAVAAVGPARHAARTDPVALMR